AVVIARVVAPPGKYRTAASHGSWVREMLTRVRAMPGVTAATAVASVPPFAPRVEIAVPGYSTTEPQAAAVRLVADGYVKTLGIRLLQGRDLNESEVIAARKVALVNQALAARYFGMETPLGRTIDVKALSAHHLAPTKDPIFEIIGVIADVKNQGVQEAAIP